jgi:transcriptional regulator with XRE-family HTH domain|nr:hypothetical protein [uncultured Brevundimonas sp.]
MSRDEPELRNDGALLSATLKSVRRYRRMTKAETAGAMRIAIRTYARFEAGETRLNLDYIHRFAAATRSDAQAILMAVAIGSPEHARRCAENQMGSIYTIGLEQFDHLLGENIRRLDSRTLITAIVRMFEDLAEALRGTDPAQDWLEQGSANLRAKRPKPGR